MMNLLNYADIERMIKMKKLYKIIRKFIIRKKFKIKIPEYNTVIVQRLAEPIPELNKLYHIDFMLNLFDYMDKNGEMQSVRFKKISYLNTPTPQSDNMISIEMQSSEIGKIAEEVCIYHYDKALYDIYGAR